MKSLFLTVALLAIPVGLAAAYDYKIGAIEIERAWSRATPKGASVAAGYVKLTNVGNSPDRLLEGSSPIAASFEIHQMTMVDGVMQMRPLKSGLEIKPGQTVELRPGSYHIMMSGLKQQLQPGQRVEATLTFEKAGSLQVEFSVERMGGSGGHAH
jgi:copper(I)-binding protein